MKQRVLPLLVSLFLILAPNSSWAQFAQRGALAGTVFDASGAVVPGTEVTLLMRLNNGNRSCVLRVPQVCALDRMSSRSEFRRMVRS